MTDPSTRAYVHWLASPASLAKGADVIRGALFKVLGVSDANRYVLDVSSTCGRVTYVDREALWGTGTPPVLPTSQADARQAAEQFLRSFAQAITEAAAKLPAEVRRAVIVPPTEPLQVAAIRRQNGPGWDHWIYRAQPMLPLADAVKAPVFGSSIEVRIGGGGKVVGYTGNWQPILPAHLTTQLRPPPAVPAGPGGVSPDPASIPLAFVWDGDGVPQFYLAPYYLVPVDDDMVLSGATPYSLEADFVWGAAEGGGTEVIVIATGGSGQYDFGFASYTPDDPWDGAVTIRDGGTRSFTTSEGTAVVAGVTQVPAGAHVVMVNIRDRRTGAFRHVQQLVIGALGAPSSSALVA